MAMFTEKLSISLPAPLVRFVEQYRSTHRCRTRSQVFEEALELLRTREGGRARTRCRLGGYRVDGLE